MRQCTCGRSKSYPYCDNTHKTKIDPETLAPSSIDKGIRETILEKIEESNKTGKVLFLKGFMKNSPDWNNFVGLIDHQYNNPLVDESTNAIYLQSKKEKYGPKLFLNYDSKCTSMYTQKNLDLHIQRIKQIPSPIHEWYNMPYLDDFLSIFNKPEMRNTVKCLINFAGNEFAGPAHSDKQAVVSWTCAGAVEYRIYHIENNTERTTLTEEEERTIAYDSYIIESGDVLYMPIGVFHSAIATSPRASLILDYEFLV